MVLSYSMELTCLISGLQEVLDWQSKGENERGAGDENEHASHGLFTQSNPEIANRVVCTSSYSCQQLNQILLEFY